MCMYVVYCDECIVANLFDVRLSADLIVLVCVCACVCVYVILKNVYSLIYSSFQLHL